MKIKIIILLILAVSSTALGQAKDKESKRSNGTEQQIIALNKLWADSITKADAAALNNLFADEMIVTAGNGDIRNKSQEIKTRQVIRTRILFGQIRLLPKMCG